MSFKNIIPIAFVLLLLNACSKREVNSGSPATIQIYNALNDGTALYINFSETRPEVFRTNRLLNNNAYIAASNRFYLNASPQIVQLYSRPDTLTKDAPMLSTKLEYENGSIYSMFIYGSKTSAQFIWRKDNIPALGMADSTMHIRFANFSENQPVSVNRKGEPTGSFIQQLQLHAFSDFIKLPANKSVTKYEFEIRDLNTGDLITTYVADKVNDFTGNTGNNPWYNKSNTLVVIGQQGGTGTAQPKVVAMPHR